MSSQVKINGFTSLTASDIRQLTADEIEAVFGGDGYGGFGGGEIVVIGPSQPSYTPSPYTPGYSGGGAGTGYSTQGVSQAANTFADQHLRNDGNTALDSTVFKEAHDALAIEYDKLSANPDAVLAVVPGDYTHPSRTVYARDVLAALGSATIHITDSTDLAGPNGVSTSATTFTTYINPQVLNSMNSLLVSAEAIKSAIDHEIAHRYIEQYIQSESVVIVGQYRNEDVARQLGHDIHNWVSVQGLNYNLPPSPSSPPSTGGGYGGYNDRGDGRNPIP